MKNYLENQFSVMSVHDGYKAPIFHVQVEDVQCFHCHKITRIPVRPEYVDWESVAEHYRTAYDKLAANVDQMVKDIDVMQSGSNPIRDYINNQWKLILEEGKHHFK